MLPFVVKEKLEEANIEMPIMGMMELFEKRQKCISKRPDALSARDLINMSNEQIKKNEFHGLEKSDAMLLKKAMIPFAFAVIPWKKW